MMALAIAAGAAVVAALVATWALLLAVRWHRQWAEACSRAAISEAHTVAQRERMEFMEREFASERRVLEGRLEVVHSKNDTLVDRLVEMATKAVAPPPVAEAERTPAEPDAETRVREIVSIDVAAQNRAAQDERIAIGADAIRRQYQQMGLTISEDEARLQAEAMLAGRAPVADGAIV